MFHVIFIVISLICGVSAGITPIRDSIVSGTSAVYADNLIYPYYTTLLTSPNSTYIAVDPTYQLSSDVAYSFMSMKESVSYASTVYNGFICGGAYVPVVGGSKGQLFCFVNTYNSSCGSSAIVSNISISGSGLTNSAVITVPERILMNSSGYIPLAQNNAHFFVYFYSNSVIGMLDVKMTSNTALVSTTGSFQSVTLPINTAPVLHHDYDGSNIYTYFGQSGTAFRAYTCPCTVSGCVASCVLRTVTGYKLLNHYAFTEYLQISSPAPIFVLANSTHVILATTTDKSLATGLTVLTASPILGCFPDYGSAINFKNLGTADYASNVYLYTLCNYIVTSSTVANSGGIYQIAYSTYTMSFATSQTAAFNSAVTMSFIGEYGHILTTTDSAATPPKSSSAALYSLYDGFNPVKFGSATMTSPPNPANTTVAGSFFSIATDITYNDCDNPFNAVGFSSGYYLTSNLNYGAGIVSLDFCGSGSTRNNNATFCDGKGGCCGDFCDYRASTYVCAAADLAHCFEAANCTGTSVNCPAAASYPDNTVCLASPSACVNNYTCQAGTCTPGGPTSNTTQCNAATTCQAAGYCNGASSCIQGAIYNTSVLCSAGNSSACLAPSYCNGFNGTCPPNARLPNGSACGTSLGICYHNNSCVSGVCVLGLPLPNGTIITPATACQSAYYCDGNGALVNGTFFSSSVTCSPANVTGCRLSSNCTGSSSSCPVNPTAPDGSSCSSAAANPCVTVATCVSGSCFVNSTAVNGTDCSQVYPCAQSAQCVSQTCVPGTLKPAGASCTNSSAATNSSGSICETFGEFCNGIDNLCHNSSSFIDGASCMIPIDATCNLTGSCFSGQCRPNSTCPLPQPVVVPSRFNFNSVSAPTGAVAGSSAAVGGLALVVALFILIILIAYRSSENDNK